MDERRQSVECEWGAQSVVLLQTHYLNRALLQRMFSEALLRDAGNSSHHLDAPATGPAEAAQADTNTAPFLNHTRNSRGSLCSKIEWSRLGNLAWPDMST